jgi:2'-5' RNA ligase
MTKREKIAALLRMTVDRGCTAAEAETARRLAAKLQAESTPIETIARRFDPPVTLDRHRSRGPRTTRGQH